MRCSPKRFSVILCKIYVCHTGQHKQCCAENITAAHYVVPCTGTTRPEAGLKPTSNVVWRCGTMIKKCDFVPTPSAGMITTVPMSLYDYCSWFGCLGPRLSWMQTHISHQIYECHLAVGANEQPSLPSACYMIYAYTIPSNTANFFLMQVIF